MSSTRRPPLETQVEKREPFATLERPASRLKSESRSAYILPAKFTESRASESSTARTRPMHERKGRKRPSSPSCLSLHFAVLPDLPPWPKHHSLKLSQRLATPALLSPVSTIKHREQDAQDKPTASHLPPPPPRPRRQEVPPSPSLSSAYRRPL